MKIDAKISLMINDDGMRIELVDGKSGIMFFRGSLDQAKTCEVLSRLARVQMSNAEVMGLENVGKRREIRTLTAQMPRQSPYDKEVAKLVAAESCPPGWCVHDTFSTQDTFFQNKGINYVRFSVIRFLDDEE